MTKTLTLAPDPVCDTEAVRVATYTRISTDEERQPNSLEAQRVRLESFVGSQPEWGIERRYEDQFTGTGIDRPAVTRMLRDARIAPSALRWTATSARSRPGRCPRTPAAPRIASLSEQAKALERRASELAAQQDDDEKPERVSAADLDALRSDLHAMLNDSDPKRVKCVLQAMIDGIRVDARDQIEPTFRVPAVRIESGYMEPAGIEPATSCLQRRSGARWVVAAGRE